MKPTIESVITKFLSLKPNKKKYVWEGKIEDYVRANLGSKGGTTSRVLRFMRADGLVSVDYKPVPRRRPCAMYRLG